MPSAGPLHYADIARAAAAAGFLCRGGFHPVAADRVPGIAADGRATLVLLGNAGPAMWRAFAATGGDGDGGSHPLDSWTRRTVEPLARALGATALFPFGGPPYLPFQAWAAKAEGLAASPLGILIHPEFGLWHAWRAALLFDRPIDLPAPAPADDPCARCSAKPCLKGCPVAAFAGRGYDVQACVGHLDDPLGAVCADFGCLARHACPVGRDFAQEPVQARFHMRAFLRAHRGRA